MKTKKTILVLTFSLLLAIFGFSQQEFNVEQYKKFLNDNVDLTAFDLAKMHPLANNYYDISPDSSITTSALYLDSIELKYEVANQEMELLAKNSFMVTERLSYPKFEDAFADIYYKDLPVFISTDAILQTLHQSYDDILKELEAKMLDPNLKVAIKALYDKVPTLQIKYFGSNATIQTAIADVDLYTTVAYSLITEKVQNPHIISKAKVTEIWNYILAEKMEENIQLFAEHTRRIDFSQFKVRGHYLEPYIDSLGNETNLQPYFKTMMWLGRIDFFLTPPPICFPEEPWSDADIKRMNLGAFLLNEIMNKSDAAKLIGVNNEIIDYLVGKSDNLTVTEFSKICSNQNIISANDLLNADKYSAYKVALQNSPEAKQAILSDLFMMEPYDSVPETLPISYKLMGQRFIVDSYIFSNLVYDRVIFQNQKIMRLMPDPLDAMFALGNNSALPLLYNELQTYHYSFQLATQRYLIDTYDNEFWNNSLYNCWLQSIRKLNPKDSIENYPSFMQTVAWQQEKLNTQLGSWTQLRHDNLLYTKQSYTGMVPACFYPHSYVEPYPEFYSQIANFANKASGFFSTTVKNSGKNVDKEIAYFSKLKSTCNSLSTISTKELTQQPFNNAEKVFLKSMLSAEDGGGCGGGGVYKGWYTDLFYDYNPRLNNDFLIVDVHTQPTDEFGIVVGKVLNAGVGKVNLGIFLAPAPSNKNLLTAFIGPVMSYYNKITNDFYRITDQEWSDSVLNDITPARPNWVNIYLAGKNGDTLIEGGNINTEIELLENDEFLVIAKNKKTEIKIYPNPSTNILNIILPKNLSKTTTLQIFDYLGRQILTQTVSPCRMGETVTIDLSQQPAGIYLVRLKIGKEEFSGKVLLVK